MSTVVIGILGQHVYPGNLAPDVQGLVNAALTGAVTFASAWFARAETLAVKVEGEVKADLAPKVAEAVKAYSQIKQAVERPPLVSVQQETPPTPVAVPIVQPVAVPVQQ
jgi:hypothetical protein